LLLSKSLVVTYELLVLVSLLRVWQLVVQVGSQCLSMMMSVVVVLHVFFTAVLESFRKDLFRVASRVGATISGV
jgi:hypothetical protein